MTEVLTNSPSRQRYELRRGEQIVGQTDYSMRDDVLELLHSHTNTSERGSGLGRFMVVEILRDARARGLRVRPYCSFVAHVVAETPEFHDLVPTAERTRFGIPAATA